MNYDEALTVAGRLASEIHDLWRSGYGNRPEQLRRTADTIEQDCAALVAYLRSQASESAGYVAP